MSDDLQTSERLRRTQDRIHVNLTGSAPEPEPPPLVLESAPVQAAVHADVVRHEEALVDELDTHELSLLTQRHLGELNATFTAPVTRQPEDQNAPDYSYKARRERRRKAETLKAQNPLADEHTVLMMQEVSRVNQVYDTASANCTPLYAGMLGNLRADYRTLHYFNRKVEFNEHGEPKTEQDRLNMQVNYKFHQDYISGNRQLVKPHLDRITREMLRVRITPDMLTPEYVLRNPAESRILSAKLTNFMDIKRFNPEYFVELPEFERDMLADLDKVSGMLCGFFAIIMRAHGVNITNGELEQYSDNMASELPGMVQFTTEQVNDGMSQFATSRRQTLEREADRRARGTSEGERNQGSILLSVKAIGEGAYKYGLPSSADIKAILMEQCALTDEQYAKLADENRELKNMLDASDKYFTMLRGMGSVVEHRHFIDLFARHKRFIEAAAAAAAALVSGQGGVGGAVGFIAMKSMSFTANIANLEADVGLTSALGMTTTVQQRIDSGEVGTLYEGAHHGPKYKQLDRDNVEIPHMSDKIRARIRESLKTAQPSVRQEHERALESDSALSAIIMTIESYEAFLENTQIPPCSSDEEKLEYPARMQQLADRLLAYNDRITARTLSYFDAHHLHRDKSLVCDALKQIVLGRDTNDSNFERVAELVYRLQHNDFSDDSFNTGYTGVMLSQALRNTALQKTDVSGTEYDTKGDAMSVVYIPKSRAGHVYRRGAAYRPVKHVRPDVQIDLDRLKGGLRVFKTGAGEMVDAHKASRDVAVTRVDQLFGEHVIAHTEHVRVEHDGEPGDEVVASKMEMASGKEAAKYYEADGITFDSRYYLTHPDTELAPVENQALNLLHPQSMMKVYWLQIVDAICGSADRHMNNFFLETDKHGAITSITGIDNDMSFGDDFIPMASMQHRQNFAAKTGNPYRNFGPVTPVYDLAFPCIPLEIYDKIVAITPQRLAQELRGSIRDSELQMAIYRLETLKRHLHHVNKYDMSQPDQVQRCAEDTYQNAKAVYAKAQAENNGSIMGNNYFTMMGSRYFHANP